MNSIIRTLKNEINNMLSRGVLTLVDASKKIQTLQIKLFGDELFDGIEHFEPYGFTSHPLENSEVLVASLSGNRNNSVALCVTNREVRLKNLQAGEVAVFTDEGDVIHFKRNNVIDINSASTVNVTAPNVNINAATKITMNTPSCEITGDLSVGGNVSDSNGSMQDMRNVFNPHIHSNGNDGQPTGGPSGAM